MLGNGGERVGFSWKNPVTAASGTGYETYLKCPQLQEGNKHRAPSPFKSNYSAMEVLVIIFEYIYILFE